MKIYFDWGKKNIRYVTFFKFHSNFLIVYLIIIAIWNIALSEYH